MRPDRSPGRLGQHIPGAAANLAARQQRAPMPPPVAAWVRTIRAVEAQIGGTLPRILRREMPQALVEAMAALIVTGIEVVVDDMRRRDDEAAS